MLSKKISVIVPVLRLEAAERCFDSVRKHLPGAEIVTDIDHDRIGCPAMVNRLTQKTTRDWVLFLGDDCELEPGFEQALEETLSTVEDDWFGVVSVCVPPNNFKGHWMAHKKMLDLLPDGKFFCEDYEHCFCDDELVDISNELDKRIIAEDAKIKHPPLTMNDEFYPELYASDKFNRDRVTYYKRKRARHGGLAIGFPLVDDRVPVQFFTSFACMEKPEQYTLLVPQFPHGPWTGSIADARNSLVEQALTDGCSHLLMLDTDQRYPADTLIKLLSHDVDICGVRVHRRWMPFDPIFLRGKLGEYESVPEDEMYSGDLIKVDATGTGCLLFDTSVFLKVNGPWFEFNTIEGKPVGEDINFCSKARDAGISIHIDTSIEVGHLATVEINRFFHQVCKHMKPKI